MQQTMFYQSFRVSVLFFVVVSLSNSIKFVVVDFRLLIAYILF